MERDVVCGMQVDPARAAATATFEGKTFYFCCGGCKAKFEREPSRYLMAAGAPAGAPAASPLIQIGRGRALVPAAAPPHHHPAHDPGAHDHGSPMAVPAPASGTAGEYICPMDPEVRQPGPGACPKCGMALEPAAVSIDTRTEWTCPMHPEVVQDHPGSCPICGMALEARTVTLDERNPELDDMSRRFWIGMALTLPILLSMAIDLLPGDLLARAIPTTARHWAEMLLATPVVVWAGWPFFARGWTSVVNRHLNMFTLIALGVGAAYGYSVVATLAPGLFPPSFRNGGHVPVYFEPAAVIVVLVLLGQVLELKARSRTGQALRRLLQLTPATARRVGHDGQESDVTLESVIVGDRLRVRPGDRVPVDGVVIDGKSAVDESMVTGESIPAPKEPGARVTGGTVNGTGSFVMRAEHVGRDTLLARIVQMVGDAQRSRAPIQRLADRVSAWFVPLVIAVAVVTFALWSVWGPEPRMAHALVNAVAVLIIACPCALGLATPMSIMVGTGRAAEVGVLFRNAEALQAMAGITALVVDKTGTLTEGRPALTGVTASGTMTDAELLRLATAVERVSEHPLAQAVVRAADERKIPRAPVSDFHSDTGRGVSGLVEGRRVTIGNRAQMQASRIDVGHLAATADDLRAQGNTVVFVAVDSAAAGLLSVADPVKGTASASIAALHREGLRIIMATGDNKLTAEAVGRRVGIDGIVADVLPAAKAEIVGKLQQAGGRVAMAGDGVNDAPALATADVGIAMGTGTDVAIESAGITLVKGDLRGIVRARRISLATMQNIRQNLFFAFVYNLLGVPVAAGLLYPFTGLLLSPMLASAAMTLSSISVIANALRLRRVDL